MHTFKKFSAARSAVQHGLYTSSLLPTPMSWCPLSSLSLLVDLAQTFLIIIHLLLSLTAPLTLLPILRLRPLPLFLHLLPPRLSLNSPLLGIVPLQIKYLLTVILLFALSLFLQLKLYVVLTLTVLVIYMC